MNEYRLRYITSGHKKNPLGIKLPGAKKVTILKGLKWPEVKEETIFEKTDKSAIKKARYLIRQANKKSWTIHSVLDRIESKPIASGWELGDKL